MTVVDKWIDDFNSPGKDKALAIYFKGGHTCFKKITDKKDAIEFITKDLPAMIGQYGDDYTILVPVQEKYESIQSMLKDRFNISDGELQDRFKMSA